MISDYVLPAATTFYPNQPVPDPTTLIPPPRAAAPAPHRMASSPRQHHTHTSCTPSSLLSSRLARLAAPSMNPIQTALKPMHAALSPLPHLGLAIEFAPAHIPRKRRLQTAAVAIWALMMPITFAVFFFLCSIPILWPLILLYLIWAYLDPAPERGGRPTRWVRELTFWRYFAAYYPVSLRKEQDLPPDRPYLFGYHPHGIIGMGAITNFATESTGFSSAFPGLNPHLLTLASNFNMPLYRDIILALGICSVSKRSCASILERGNGMSCVIVVGGAAESLNARPGTNDLTLMRRLGFIKVAIQHGADLVPVFSFGENDIYHQMPNEKGTTVYTLQKKFQNVFGFTLPLFHGRGVFNYNFGLMPHRRSIVSVIGRPIHVTKNDKPTKEEVQAVQKLYIEELLRIWNKYKDTFARQRTRELSIID
ncbi:diacylglycerol acyltransferase-domain-containing protein [Gautieria morchelliformis]|nr:diacylglycerol acyltransferase-domain-containing protein [Gautieria morchelliformis]